MKDCFVRERRMVEGQLLSLLNNNKKDNMYDKWIDIIFNPVDDKFNNNNKEFTIWLDDQLSQLFEHCKTNYNSDQLPEDFNYFVDVTTSMFCDLIEDIDNNDLFDLYYKLRKSA